jgi:competence protein ComEC
LIGLHLLLASAAKESWEWIYFLPLALFWMPLLKSPRKPLPIPLLGSLLLFAVTFWQISPSPIQDECVPLEGIAYFSPSSLQVQQSPFQRSFVYKGTLRHFASEQGHVLQNIPCQIYTPLNSAHPTADGDYLLAGTLNRTPHSFLLKPQPKTLWKKIPHTFSLAEWRFRAKEKIRSLLKTPSSDPKSAPFLATLATGDLDERRLSLEFGKLGMQHILVVSGFHFALIAAFFSLLFRLFFSPKVTDSLTLLIVTFYFLLIGNSPSVLRAQIAISLVLCGRLLGLRSSALNALGVALIIELLIDPHCVCNLGFQLSFLCTLAILLGYPLLHTLFSHLLPIRSYKIVLSMSLIDQCGALLSTLLRKTLALNCAIHLFSLPVILFLFHKFPLFSLVYNLFFPFLVSLSLLLLCTAFVLGFLPPLTAFIHQCNTLYTSFFLDLCSNPPAPFEFYLRIKTLPFSLVIIILSLLFFGAIAWKEKQKV